MTPEPTTTTPDRRAVPDDLKQYLDLGLGAAAQAPDGSWAELYPTEAGGRWWVGVKRPDGRVRANSCPLAGGEAMFALVFLNWPGDPHAVVWLPVWEGPFVRNPFAGG